MRSISSSEPLLHNVVSSLFRRVKPIVPGGGGSIRKGGWSRGEHWAEGWESLRNGTISYEMGMINYVNDYELQSVPWR